MPAFLKNIEPYRGDGSKNEKGQTLEEFLEAYDPNHYENPCMTADVLVVKHPTPFEKVEDGLQVLMIKRRNHPSIGYWALPGGFVEIHEDLDQAAKRELQEETGLTGVEVAQVATYGEENRDPRARIITATYVSLVDEDVPVEAGDDAKDAAFFHVTLEKIGEKEENDNHIDTFLLKLLNKDKNVSLEATLDSWYNKKSMLRARTSKVISSRGIAFDHARSVLETLLYVKGKL